MERARSDGFTMMEVVVTIALISIVLVPLAGIFYATGDAAVSNSNRENASGLAAQILAKLRASSSTPLGYDSVGFTSSTIQGLGSSYATQPAGSTASYWDYDGDADAFGPSGGGTFLVTTHVLWASTRLPGCPPTVGVNGAVSSPAQAYKRVIVDLSWSDGHAGHGTYVLDGLVYPGGLAPYSGPSYSTSSVPPSPTAITASPGPDPVTGQLEVSFTVPANWSPSGCFSVGWSDTSQVVGSTPILANSDPGYTSDPTAGRTATYTVGASYPAGGLAQNAAYVFFVTAWSGNGLESNESEDSAIATAPAGPVITSVAVPGDPSGTLAYGQTGTQLNVKGSGLIGSGGNATFYFVPANVTNPTQYTAYPSAASSGVTCANAQSCTITVPAPVAADAPSGLVDVVALATPTSGGGSVFSPTLLGDQMTYAPIVTGLRPSQGSVGAAVAISVSNRYSLLGGVTTFSFGGQSAGPGLCVPAPPGETCTVSAPSNPAGSVIVSAGATTTSGLAFNPQNGPSFGYLN